MSIFTRFNNIGRLADATSPRLWSPLEITMGVWYDAADSATITELTDSVSQWDDKSGNVRNITQGLGASQPTTNTDTIGGLNAIAFNNDYLYRSNLDLFRNIGEGMIISVVKNQDIVSNSRYTSHIKTGGAGLTRASIKNRSDVHALGARRLDSDSFVQSSGNALTTSPILQVGIFNYTADEMSMRSNGLLVGTDTSIFSSGGGNTSDTNASELTLGNVAANPTIGRGFIGLIAETIIVENDISIDTIEKLEGYLAWKWGLVTNLPVAHSYKNKPPVI
jgi:hypothetical protein